MSVCVCVCLSALSRSRFLIDFTKSGMEVENLTRWERIRRDQHSPIMLKTYPERDVNGIFMPNQQSRRKVAISIEPDHYDIGREEPVKNVMGGLKGV